MITQLNPPIPLLTPRGEGFAHLVIDYGVDHDLQWTVFIHETGESWTFRNQDVRAVANITMGRHTKYPLGTSHIEAPLKCGAFFKRRHREAVYCGLVKGHDGWHRSSPTTNSKI